jgi:hypothetical protein
VQLFIKSVSYTVNGVIFKIVRWPLLSVATLLFGIPLNGYIVRIYRGADPAPDINNWKSLFSDGLKLMIVEILYVIVIWFITSGILSLVVYLNPWNIAKSYFLELPRAFGFMGWYGIMGWLIPPLWNPIPFLLFWFILGFFFPVASIRFARSNNFFEAFNVRAVIGDVCKIGLFRYLLAMILFFVVIVIPLMFFNLIIFFLICLTIFEGGVQLQYLATPFLILIVVIPLITVFTARYLTLLYDSAGAEKLP